MPACYHGLGVYTLQAHPGGVLHVLSLAMHVSPQAFPSRHTLQQEAAASLHAGRLAVTPNGAINTSAERRARTIRTLSTLSTRNVGSQPSVLPLPS